MNFVIHTNLYLPSAVVTFPHQLHYFSIKDCKLVTLSYYRLSTVRGNSGNAAATFAQVLRKDAGLSGIQLQLTISFTYHVVV